MQLIVAEKPSVARDIARVLGVRAQGRECFESEQYVITWCVGHLAELEEPAGYDGAWKHWRMDTLPMLPAPFRLRPATSAPGQFRAVRTLLRERRFDEVVNACDAGREGELIFRYVYELAGSKLPVKRLWISSMTDEVIRRGFSQLKPGAQYDALGAAARSRSEADWLVGLNATRALTLKSRRPGEKGTIWSIGRVQTPTLALLVHREEAIRAFVPVDYREVRGTFTSPGHPARFVATYAHTRRTRFARAELASEVVRRAGAHAAAGDALGPRVERVAKKTVNEPPPLLFDLTSLQRTANRRFGFSAARTLEIAQALYERHKTLTYPRTDSRHLTGDVARELPRLFTALAGSGPYAPFAQPLIDRPPSITRRVFDDAKVTDHHAIIPTGRVVALDGDERKIFDLVVRRFLGVFHPDAEFAITDVVVRVGGPDTSPATSSEGAADTRLIESVPPPPDRFHARGRVRVVAGWQDVAGIDGTDEPRMPGEAPALQTLPAVREGEALDGAFDMVAKQTSPPARYTEATLLAAMEGAGRTVDDEAMRDAMRDRGLGTPATRAAIIETLLKRGFTTRDRKSLVPTPMGLALIASLPVASLGSAELTGAWEARLARVARGEEAREDFMRDIATYVREVVGAIRDASPPPAASVAQPPGASVGRCPRCGGTVTERARDFACATGASPCGFALPRVVAGRAVSPALAAVLLGRGRTQVLHGFRAKTGRSFGAALVLGEDGDVRFEFAERAAPTATSHGAEAATTAPGAAVARPARPRGPVDLTGLVCARCRSAGLIAGRSAWGCARWREGCAFTVPFEVAGRALDAKLLRELLDNGRTRAGRYHPGHGPVMKGHLVLDAFGATGATVRFEPTAKRTRRVKPAATADGAMP